MESPRLKKYESHSASYIATNASNYTIMKGVDDGHVYMKLMSKYFDLTINLSESRARAKLPPQRYVVLGTLHGKGEEVEALLEAIEELKEESPKYVGWTEEMFDDGTF